MTTNTLNNICINDFTVTSPTSGVDRNLIVSNTTDQANSSATILAQVAGGTALDPKIQFTVNGVTNWAAGLDNSVSDSFTLGFNSSLGTSSTYKINTSGLTNLPLQPCFRAHRDANLNNCTGDLTRVSIIAPNEDYDITNNYNSGTGAFVAPIAGKYLFTGGVYLSNISIGAGHTNTQLFPRVAETRVASSVINTNVVVGGVLKQNFSITVLLAAGDSVFYSVIVAGGTKTVTINASTDTFFAGQLLS